MLSENVIQSKKKLKSGSSFVEVFRLIIVFTNRYIVCEYFYKFHVRDNNNVNKKYLIFCNRFN